MKYVRQYPRVKESFYVREKNTEIGFDIAVADGSVILKVINYLRNRGFNILHFEWSGGVNRDTAIFLVVDLAKEDPQKIIDDLRRLDDGVLHVSLAPVVVGKLVYSNILYPILVSNSRGIVLTLGVTGGMFKVFKEHFGEDMSASILYHSGYAMGRELYKFFVEPLNPKTMENTIDIFKVHMISAGVGLIKDYHVSENGEIIIDVGDLWECDYLRNKVKKPASNLFRGILSGVLSSFLNKEMVVKETRCIAIGDSFCRFKLTTIT